MESKSNKKLPDVPTSDGTALQLLEKLDREASSPSTGPKAIRIEDLSEEEKEDINSKYGNWTRTKLVKSDRERCTIYMDSLTDDDQIMAKFQFTGLPEHDKYACISVITDFAVKSTEYAQLGDKSGRRARVLREFLSRHQASLDDFLGTSGQDSGQQGPRSTVQKLQNELRELQASMAKLASAKSNEADLSAAVTSVGRQKFENKWPAGQQPPAYDKQTLDYAAWLDELQPLLETFFEPARWWTTIFTLLPSATQKVVLAERRRIKTFEARTMTYADLMVFLCRTFRHTGRLHDLQAAWEALKLDKTTTFASFWAQMLQVRSDLQRTKDPVSDARAVARVVAAISGNKALTAALKTTIIEERTYLDWTWLEFERTIKVLADVHHVPASASASASGTLAALASKHALPDEVVIDLSALMDDKGKGKGKGKKGKGKSKGKHGRGGRGFDSGSGASGWQAGWRKRQQQTWQSRQDGGRRGAGQPRFHRGMLKERFLARGGNEADWQRRMALPWTDVREEHRSLFAHDSVQDDKGKWQMACARCRQVGSHTAVDCAAHRAALRALQDA